MLRENLLPVRMIESRVKQKDRWGNSFADKSLLGTIFLDLKEISGKEV